MPNAGAGQPLTPQWAGSPRTPASGIQTEIITKPTWTARSAIPSRESLTNNHFTRENLTNNHFTRENLTNNHFNRESLTNNHFTRENLTNNHNGKMVVFCRAGNSLIRSFTHFVQIK